jgi:ribosomal protein L25 (general stress protein Ctc)
MVKKNILFLLTTILFQYSFSQNNYEYFGAIILNDSTTITYKISMVNNRGEVKGYSVTDLGGEHETRSNIFGEYDDNIKELSFRETGIVYTKSPVSQQDFCFINTTIKGFTFKKTKNIKTKFVGLFSDNTQCIDGELLMSSVEKVEKRIEKVTKQLNKTSKIPDSIKQKINPIKMMDSLNMNILRKGQVLSMFSEANQIKINIYDGGKLDGDKITILVNGKPYLTNYEAHSDKKILTLNLNEDKTSVVIKALNEGTIQPNTIVVELYDNKNSIRALSNLKVGETTQIDILKTN